MATSPIYKEYTDVLGRLLSIVKLSYESGHEWARVKGILRNLRLERELHGHPYTLHSGPVQKLLDAGLIPFLTDIVEDERVRLTAADLLPDCPNSAVSRQIACCRAKRLNERASAIRVSSW